MTYQPGPREAAYAAYDAHRLVIKAARTARNARTTRPFSKLDELAHQEMLNRNEAAINAAAKAFMVITDANYETATQEAKDAMDASELAYTLTYDEEEEHHTRAATLWQLLSR